MANYFPYSQIIAGLGTIAMTKHPYFSAWSVGSDTTVSAKTELTEISELYY